MYQLEENPGVERSEELYTVGEQARHSYDALRETLSAPPPQPGQSTSPETKDRLAASVHPRILTWKEGEPKFSTPKPGLPQSGSAAQTLRLMLDKTQGNETLEAGDSSETIERPKRDAPSADEVSTLLQQHTVYANQIESENRYIKEELAVLRLKLLEVVEENKRLHAELKTTVVHEILRDGDDVVKFMGSMEDGLAGSVTSAMSRHDYKRWQVELERLSRLHAAKCDRLESQLSYSKTEVQRMEQVIEDLKSQLRVQDTVPTHDSDLATGELMALTASSRVSFQGTIDKLMKERDEMCERVLALTAQNQTLAQKEEELYQQVKKGIFLVEQAQLEQTEAMVQKEQLAEELGRMRERFEQHVRTNQVTMQQEREAARKENQFLIEDLSKQLLEQQSKFAVITEKLDKEVREKGELSTNLIELKGQLRACDREVTIAAENYRAHSTSATLQRSSATEEADKLRAEFQQVQRDRDQEKKILQNEVSELKRRLQTAEHDLLNAKEECVNLTNSASAIERELHLAKLAREAVERGRLDDLKMIVQRASEREAKLRSAMDDTDEKHAHQVQEMDSILLRQSKLIMKLQDECKRQALEVERLNKKYRAQNTKLKNELDTTTQQLERTLSRLTLLEDQTEQHGRVHEKMTARVKAMDDHAQNQGMQLVEILAVNSGLVRDRQLLAKEVEFLRAQMTRINTAQTDRSDTSAEGLLRLQSTSKPLVDDILNALTREEQLEPPSGTTDDPKLSNLAKTATELPKLSNLAKTATELEDETEAQALKEELEGEASCSKYLDD